MRGPHHARLHCGRGCATSAPRACRRLRPLLLQCCRERRSTVARSRRPRGGLTYTPCGSGGTGGSAATRMRALARWRFCCNAHADAPLQRACDAPLQRACGHAAAARMRTNAAARMLTRRCSDRRQVAAWAITGRLGGLWERRSAQALQDLSVCRPYGCSALTGRSARPLQLCRMDSESAQRLSSAVDGSLSMVGGLASAPAGQDMVNA